MELLVSDELNVELERSLKSIDKSICILTAYCKKEALKFIDENMDGKEEISKKIVIRYRLDDILSKATDFDVYEYCKTNNWKMYIMFNLHAKTYILDNKTCYIGSANLTKNGLGLKEIANVEITKKFDISNEENNKIEEILKNALPMTDELYQKMRNQINNLTYNKVDYQWDEDVICKSKMNHNFNVLFQHDFPINNSPLYLEEDEIYLDIDKDQDINSIKEKFYYSKIMQYLISILKEKEDREIYFGELTSKIHSLIFQEPVQYRVDVKLLVIKLITWIERLDYEDIVVDTPNYSQRIRLI